MQTSWLRQMVRSVTGIQIALCGLYVVFYGSLSAWSPFFNVYLAQIGLTGLQIGALASARPLATLLCQPAWGLLADTQGRRRVLVFTLLASAVLMPGFLLQHNFVFVLVWLILVTVISAPSGVLLDSLNLDFVESRPGSAFGTQRLWGAVGWAAFGSIIGWVVFGRDLGLTFICAGVLLLLSGLLAFFAPLPAGNAEVSAVSWSGVGNLLRNRSLLLVLGLVVALQTTAAAIFSFYPVYLNQIGGTSQQIGLAITLQGVSELPMYLGATQLLRRLRPLPTLMIAMAVYAGRMLLYSVVTSPELAVLIELSHGFSFALFLVASVELIDQQVGRQWRATGQALLSAAWMGIGSTLGNLWAGWMSDNAGVQAMFRVNGIAMVVVLVLTWLLTRSRQQPAA